MRFIFDLDHTLIDSSHRQLTRADGSLDLTHWRENCTRDAISRDSLLPLARECRQLIADNANVIACTARVMSPADYDFLKVHGLEFDAILSRPVGCNDSDHLLKEWLLRDYANTLGLSFRRFARGSGMLDDNANVLAHLKSLGFHCMNAISLNNTLAGVA